MEAVWQWGIDLIHLVQLASGPALDAFFTAITFLGEEEFFLLLLPFFLWCFDFTAGARVGVAFLLSTYVNIGLKDWFAHPRPFELEPTVKRYEVGGYGLPSGHAQSAVVVWGAIAIQYGKKWLWGVAILLMILIGFSRIYLGVHFPTDVLGGWAVGAIFLALYTRLGPRLEQWLKQASPGLRLTLAATVPLGLLVLHPTADVAAPTAVLMGMGMGLVLTRRKSSFSAAGPPAQRAVRLLVGMAVLLPLYFGLKLVFPGSGEPFYVATRVLRYAVVGFWVALGAPWLFRKLRLAPD